MTNQPFMNTAHYGTVFSKDGHDIDDCVVTKFNNPHSFTGEDLASSSMVRSWSLYKLLAF